MSNVAVILVSVIIYCVALFTFLYKWEGMGSFKGESEPNGMVGFGSMVCALTVFYMLGRLIAESLLGLNASELDGPFALLLGGYGYHTGLVLFAFGFTVLALGNYLAPSSHT